MTKTRDINIYVLDCHGIYLNTVPLCIELYRRIIIERPRTITICLPVPMPDVTYDFTAGMSVAEETIPVVTAHVVFRRGDFHPRFYATDRESVVHLRNYGKEDDVSEKKELGKIESVSFGRLLGRGDDMLGLKLVLGGKNWSVGADILISTIDESDFYHDEQHPDDGIVERKVHEKNVRGPEVVRLIKLLREAKARTVDDLRGKPIEVTFAGNGMSRLVSWRILTEVL